MPRLVPVRASILVGLSAVVSALVLALGLVPEVAGAAVPGPLPWRPGAPALGFGSSGAVSLDPPQGKPSYGEQIAVDPSGRVLVLTNDEEGEGLLTRLLPGGAPDPEFAAGGWVRAPAGEWEEIALDPQGRILLAGAREDEFAVARLTPRGAPDPEFGTDGVALLRAALPAAETTAREMFAELIGRRNGGIFVRVLALADGSVIAAGSTGYCAINGCGGASGVVAKFDGSGALDTSFGESGIEMLATAARPDPKRGRGVMRELRSLAIQPDGKIVVGGSDSRLLVVVRLTAAGAVDRSFGERGSFVTDGETEGEDATYNSGSARDLLIQKSGRIVVLGKTRLFGVRANGHLDRRFGYAPHGNTPVSNSGYSSSLAADALLDRAGRIIVVGNLGGGPGVARFLPGGLPDPRFGGGGTMSVRVGKTFPPPESAGPALVRVAQLPGGDLVAVGFGYFGPRHAPRAKVVLLGRNDRSGRFAYCGKERATYQGTPRSDGLGWVFGTLVTFGGNDKIGGGGGAVCAGAGDDTVINRTNWSEPIYLGPGDDRSRGSTGRIFGGPGDDRIELGEYSEGPLVANGGPGRDRLVGSGEADRLEGGPGDDVLVGGDSRDVLIGGPGNDVLIGSKGDVFRPGPGRNRIVIRP